MITGVELDQDIAVAVKLEAIKKHLLMNAARPNVIRLIPPLIATKEDCDKAYDIIEEILKTYN